MIALTTKSSSLRMQIQGTLTAKCINYFKRPRPRQLEERRGNSHQYAGVLSYRAKFPPIARWNVSSDIIIINATFRVPQRHLLCADTFTAGVCLPSFNANAIVDESLKDAKFPGSRCSTITKADN